MYCVQCGSKILNNNIFCAQCGNKVDNATFVVHDTKYCVKCGSQISKITTFCTQCGNKVDNSTPVVYDTRKSSNKSSKKWTNPQIFPNIFSNKRLVYRIAAGVCVLIVLVGIFNMATSSGKSYLYATLLKTLVAYEKELDMLVEKNVVLKQIKTNTAKSYVQEFRSKNFSLSLSDDKKSHRLALELDSSVFPVAKLFLSDRYIIAGIPQLAYFEVDPKNVGSDFQMFFEDSDVNMTTDIIKRWDGMDLSYSGIMNGKLKGSKSIAEIRSRYIEVAKKFLEQAEYSREKSKVTIGTKEVKANRIILTMDSEDMDKWLNENLMTVLRDDPDLESHWNLIYSLATNNRTMMSRRDFLRGLEDNFALLVDNMEEDDGKLVIKADVYKGVIVSLKILMDREDISLTLTATGKKYRLDNISFEYEDYGYYDQYLYVQVQGEHIGKNLVKSNVEISQWGSSNKYKIDWDAKAKSNNFAIQSLDSQWIYTFALEDKEVYAKFDFLDGRAAWRLAPLTYPIEFPKTTTVLRETSLQKVISEVLSGI